MLSNTSFGFISDMEVIDHKHCDDKENKIENLRLQECSLKNRSFQKFVISREKYMKWRQ